MSDCTTCGDSGEQAVGYSGGETIDDPTCYPTGCPPCSEAITFPENPINGQRQCFFIGKDPNTGEDKFKCWVYDHCIPGWRAEGPSASPITFKGSVDLTRTPADQNIAPVAGDYYVVAKASEDQTFLDTNWADLQHPVALGTYILWTGTEYISIFPPCGSGSNQVGPTINLDACGSCGQVLQIYYGLQPISSQIPNAITTGQSAVTNLVGTGTGMRVNWSSGLNTNNVVSIEVDNAHIGEGYADGDIMMLNDQTTWGLLGYLTDYQNSPAVGDLVTNAATTNVVGSSTGLTVDYQIRAIGGDNMNKYVYVKPNVMGTGMNRGDTFTIDGLDGVEIRYDAPQFRLRDNADEIFLTQTECDPATIGCEYLPIASDTNRGIVQLATNLDPTSPGYYNNAVTPALLQRIFDNFVRTTNPDLDPGDAVQVTRHFSEDSTWRPLQPSRLVKVVIQMIGGGGGGGPNGPIVATDHTGNPVWNPGDSGGSSQWGLSKELTPAEVGTEATITIGQGGQWSDKRMNEEGGFLASPGTATIFQTNGTIGQVLMPGGNGARDLVASTGGWPNGWYPTWGEFTPADPSEAVNIESYEVNYQISGKGGGGIGESEYTNSFAPGRPGSNGTPGYVIINEYYPGNSEGFYLGAVG